MNNDHTPRLFIMGGICGIVGTLCYVIASMVPMSPTGTYVLAMAWPKLSVVFVFSLFRFIGHARPGAANNLAFVLASLAFVLVASMMSVQLAVRIGLEEYIQSAVRTAQESLELARTSNSYPRAADQRRTDPALGSVKSPQPAHSPTHCIKSFRGISPFFHSGTHFFLDF